MIFKKISFKKVNWKKYFFESLSVFLAVFAAFALNNWNLERRDNNAARDILKEVKNGIKNDILSIEQNKRGNIYAKKSCIYLRKLIENKVVNQDSIAEYYNGVFSNFSFTPNKTGYDGLSSKGLDIITDDLLRVRITYYYSYYFDELTKLEEQNERMQAYKNYFFPINNLLVENMVFNETGKLIKIKQSIVLSELDKNKLRSYLWQIEGSRDQMINVYEILEKQMKLLDEHVTKSLKEKMN